MPRCATTASWRGSPEDRVLAGQPGDRRPRRDGVRPGCRRRAAPRGTPLRGVLGQLLEHGAHRRHGGLVAHQQQVRTRRRRELDAAVVEAATRRHQHDAVTDARPVAAHVEPGPTSVALEVQHDVDDEGGLLAGAADVADRVGAHVAALRRGRARARCAHQRLVGTLRRGDAAGDRVGEDQLDPLVAARRRRRRSRPARPAELDADEARRQPLDGDHLDLGEEHGQRGGGHGHRFSWRGASGTWRPTGTTSGVCETGSSMTRLSRPKTVRTTSSVTTSAGVPSATIRPSCSATRWSA